MANLKARVEGTLWLVVARLLERVLATEELAAGSRWAGKQRARFAAS